MKPFIGIAALVIVIGVGWLFLKPADPRQSEELATSTEEHTNENPSVNSGRKIKGIELPATDQKSIPITFLEYPSGVSADLDAVYELHRQSLEDAKNSGTKTGVHFQIASVDLNYDDVDEVFAQELSGFSCGTHGCTFALHIKGADGVWHPGLSGGGLITDPSSGYLLPFRTNNWDDLAFKNSAGFSIWRMNNEGVYELAGVAPSIPL